MNERVEYSRRASSNALGIARVIVRKNDEKEEELAKKNHRSIHHKAHKLPEQITVYDPESDDLVEMPIIHQVSFPLVDANKATLTRVH